MKKMMNLILFLVFTVALSFSGCTTRKVVVVEKESPPPPPAANNYGQSVASQKHVQNGIKHLNRGNYPKAAKEFDRAIAADPNNWEAHFYLGVTYQRWRHYHESVRPFRTAIELNRDDYRWVSKVRVHLGVTLEYTGNYEEARNEYNLAVTLNPDNKEAVSRLEKLKEKKKSVKPQKKEDKKKYSQDDESPGED